jgi:hypothetical protein
MNTWNPYNAYTLLIGLKLHLAAAAHIWFRNPQSPGMTFAIGQSVA